MNFNDFVFILLPATGTIPKEKVLYSCFALFWITFSVFSNKRHYRRWIELFCLAFHLHFKMVFSGKLYQSNKTLVFFSSIHSEVKWKSYFWFYKQGRKRWARMIKGHKAQIWMEAFRIYVDDDWSISTTYPCLTGLRYRLELLLIVKAKIDILRQWFFWLKRKNSWNMYSQKNHAADIKIHYALWTLSFRKFEKPQAICITSHVLLCTYF